MDAPGLQRLQHGGRQRGGRFHRDAFEREIHLQYARESLRLVDADLRAGERMLAGLEDQALIAPDRLVTRIARDLDEADGDARLRWCRLGRR